MDDEYDDCSPPNARSQDSTNTPQWSFNNISPEHTASSSRPRPQARTSRSNSLPRTLHNSIFGSSPLPTRPMQQEQQEDGGPERPPTFAVSPPSQEHLPDFQPPLSTLSTEIRKRGSWYEEDERAVVDRRRIPQVEKDADDPTAAPSSSRSAVIRRESTTLTTLSRLFAVQAPTMTPGTSRNPSYTMQWNVRQPYTRNLITAETAALPDHLYTRGLLEGRHSDITVNAFGHQYKLHRIMLDRAPFFRSALSEPWLEARATETTVHPEDIDTSITQSSFELALKRLYGCASVHEEDKDAVGLFATGCWLEMQDLIESSIESMLRQMSPETLSPLIKLVTSNYYGRAGDKVLASAKAMLCRDGWRMPLRYWDGIPGDVIREIVGGDGFFIDGEWERWVLGKRILDRRLRLRAIEVGLVEPGSGRRVLKAPDTANLMAVRFDTVYRRNAIGTGRGVPDSLHRWIGLYTHPDVEPILVLLDEGIHYIHLDFEQLQFIKGATDVLGLPVLPQKVVGDALWQQMELRQKVLNSREAEMELGISVRCTEDAVAGENTRDTTMSIMTPTSPPQLASPGKGKHKVEDLPEAVPPEEELDSGSWDGNGRPRKFWIPSSDCNIVMGGNADPVIATSNNTTLQRHASRLSATIQPEDVQWASDFSAVTSQPRMTSNAGAAGDNGSGGVDGGVGDVRYTHFPPFRFAAEFPNPRLLKEKKRFYSRTVFYAGSLWNIYIQKVASTRSKQLGVYLHRAKERETEEVIAGTAGMAQGSVDDRIGMLEREMLLRSERRERKQRRRTTVAGDVPLADGTESEDGSAGDHDTATAGDNAGDASGSARSNIMRDLLARSNRRNTPQAGAVATSSSPPDSTSAKAGILTPESEDDSSDTEDDSETERLISASKRFHVPTLPPYVDARPTIKTYFKIYSPSRGGRMLSVYESAPDRFNFSQSWGWKSSTLMVDESAFGDGDDGGAAEGEQSAESGDGEKVAGNGGRAGFKGKGDGKLRFIVCIGNI